LHRVLQELVSNIIRHAKAAHFTIQFVRHDDELAIMIEDDGAGFDPEKTGSSSGIGIKNIRTRIDYLGGDVFWDSRPGSGTTVTLEIPLRHD
jgi:signal transduction histidine kinase